MHYKNQSIASNDAWATLSNTRRSIAGPSQSLAALAAGFGSAAARVYWWLVVLSLASGLLLQPTTHAAGGNENWSGDFVIPGLDGPVYESVEDNAGNLYIAGDFTAINGSRVNGIAMWDGVAWSALGTGVDGDISDMAVDSNGNLYIAGTFSQAGRQAVSNVAVWDGSAWSGLGTGVDNAAYVILIDDTDQVYVGGRFSTAGGSPAERVALWQDGAWSALGAGPEDDVSSLLFNPEGELLAGGAFGINKWVEGSWSDFDAPIQGRIRKMVTGPDGALYVGGGAFWTNSRTYFGIARWSAEDAICIATATENACTDGWTSLGGGVALPNPYAGVQDLLFDQNGTLYVGGRVRSFGDENQQQILSWNGLDWVELTPGIAGQSVSTLTLLADGGLFAGGSFTVTAQAGKLNSVAIWDGVSWSGFASQSDRPMLGLNDYVSEMVAEADGDLFVTGGFTQAGNIDAEYIVRWDGQGWNALDGSPLQDAAAAMAADGNGNLYVAIDDYRAPGVSIWNAAGWQTMNTGLRTIYSFTDIVANSAGQIYLSGEFAIDNGPVQRQIARWNGSQWVVVGRVEANYMALTDGGLLYVSGYFSSVNGIDAGGIARWDGSNWNTLMSADQFSSVDQLALAADDTLLASAYVQLPDFSLDNGLWRWDGSSWALEVDIPGPVSVSALQSTADGQLFVGLDFGDGNLLLQWDGSDWVNPGSGITGVRINALALYRTNALFAGGLFSTSGGQLAGNIAQYTLDADNIDTDGDGLTDRVERALGLSVTSTDTDNDGVEDGDEDSDGDGATNVQELQAGTDPGIDPETAADDVPALLTVVQLGADESTVEEGTDIVVTIKRSGDINRTVSVDYEVSGTPGGDIIVQEEIQESASLLDFFIGRAVANVAATGTLVWPAGDTADRLLRISVLPDEIPEGSETIEVALLDTSSGSATVNATLTFTISDPPLASVPTMEVADLEWTLFSVPAMAGGQTTLRDVIADDIVMPYANTQGAATWAVFEYISQGDNPRYRLMELDDELEPGVGYWLIHDAGETLVIDLPSTTLASIVGDNDGCASANGCFQREMDSDSDGRRWQILGNPFYRSTNPADIRVVSVNGDCAAVSGCSLTQASETGIVSDTLWGYDGLRYEAVQPGDALEPWKGYWSSTAESASVAQPSLLIPNQ